MKIFIKVFLTQIISIVLAYFVSNWLGDYLDDDAFWIKSGGLLAFAVIPYIYVFFITLFSGLWFQGLSRWSYMVPVIAVLFFDAYLGYISGNLFSSVGFLLIAFLGGWVLAWVVNFVAGLIKK